jgi:hypothetical protein
MEPFTMTHLLMAATAGAALPSLLGGKGKGISQLLKMQLTEEPSEEEKATYRGFKAKNGGFVRGQGKAMRGGGCAMKGKRK